MLRGHRASSRDVTSGGWKPTTVDRAPAARPKGVWPPEGAALVAYSRGAGVTPVPKPWCQATRAPAAATVMTRAPAQPASAVAGRLPVR